MKLRTTIGLIWGTIALLSIGAVWADDVKLTADERVEYYQKEQKLVAVGNAKAVRGNMSISARRLVGYYAPKTKNKIARVEAEGNVVMTSAQTKAKGESLVYDANEDKAILKGKTVHIKSPDAEIIAQNEIVFYQAAMRAESNDGVEAIDAKGSRVRADKMTAYFAKDDEGKTILDKVDIAGNVRINSQDAVITALRGTYFAALGIIKLYDDVVIEQNGNVLKGSAAEADLNSGVSRILSGGGSRVSGVFKENKNKQNKE
ncbi:MAG: hypothetical protein IJ529_04115 [Alphaproteobacteria bacterium]|nr:hypothetical protein [Alphaproteobacteria bacterium]MBQ9235680.1 hypothetical protein [Alphaproteobacteria bacterium]